MQELVGDQTYTLTEAARLTGLSVDALRQRAKRGKLETVKGNDGLIRVRLTAADLNPARLDNDQSPDSRPRDGDQTPGMLQAALTSLQEELASARARAGQAEAVIAELRERLDRIEQEREAIRQEREDARVKAALIEGEARGLREALAESREALTEARRPWWRKALGLP